MTKNLKKNFMSNKKDVFFVKLNEADKLEVFLSELKGRVAVKTHFGEQGNTAYIKADKIKGLCKFLDKPTLIETTVLYKSKRTTALGHKQVALEHGFDFAPIDIIDGEDGDIVKEVKIDKKHFEKCYIGGNLDNYDSLLVISHFKGHMGAGFGGAIKNLGMGLASRKGKLAQHASIQHVVKESKCIACGVCLNECPVGAITIKEEKANINEKICISCSKCIAHCPTTAIEIPWASTATKDLQERIAEYAMAAVGSRSVLYINFLTDIVEFCDCFGDHFEPLTEDIGILVSDDPVAIDKASYDLVIKQYPDFNKHNGTQQLIYGEKIGLGSMNYKLINK